jgi:hypothetical protein
MEPARSSGLLDDIVRIWPPPQQGESQDPDERPKDNENDPRNEALTRIGNYATTAS